MNKSFIFNKYTTLRRNSTIDEQLGRNRGNLRNKRTWGENQTQSIERENLNTQYHNNSNIQYPKPN